MVRRTRLLLLLLGSCCSPHLPAQVSATIAVPSVSGTPGTSVVIPVTLVASEPVVAFSFGIAHDDQALTITSVAPGAAIVGSPTNFFPNLAPAGGAGVTMGVLIDPDLVPPFASLTAGVPHLAVELTYFVATDAPLGTNALSFTGALGEPPVPLHVVTDAGIGDLVESPLVGVSGAIGVVETAFRRGDGNDDGGITILDALRVLEMIFLPTGGTTCLDKADVNDNGILGVDDAVYLLQYLFLGVVGPPPPPFPHCGVDPTPDTISCTVVQGACP